MADIIYFSHGGGPLPILGDSSHKFMVNFLKKLSDNISKPSAIVLISAHWEESQPTIIGSEKPTLLYDYYGFPDEAYNITYTFKGDSRLAIRLKEIFRNNNSELCINSTRGVDHGVFIPMKLLYPKGDIPIIELSMIKGLDPKVHLDLGRILADLRGDNVMIIGSGFSFHNMSLFSFDTEVIADKKNDEFQDWLIDICTGDYSPEEREEKLINWESAPNARYCHPREEHLLPLHICAGASKNRGIKIFDDYILGKRSVAFRWEY